MGRNRAPDVSVAPPLTPEQQLALAFAPAHQRGAIASLFELDRTLGEIVRREAETGLKQLKLAWWREVLGANSVPPEAPPVLRRLAEAGYPTATLRDLAEGWELLLQEQLTAADIRLFAQHRAKGWTWAAGLSGTGEPLAAAAAGTRWALADFAIHVSDPRESQAAIDLLVQQAGSKLPRALRWMSILEGLTLRRLSAIQGKAPRLGEALRLTILGQPYRWQEN